MGRKLLHDTTGTSAVEYGIIAALISVVAIGAMGSLGTQSNEQLKKVGDAYEDARAPVA